MIKKTELTNKRINSLYATIIILFSIYITDTVLFATNSNDTLVSVGKLSILVMIILIVVKKLYSKSFVFNIQEIVFLFIIFCIFFTSMVNQDFSKKLFSKILLLLLGYLISSEFSYERFGHIYLVLMRIIASMSLIMYFFSDYLSKIPFILRLTNTMGVRFYSLFFSNMYANWPLSLLRNPGPFWEPGVFQAYLLIGMIFSVMIEKKRKTKILDLVLFIITLITTYSTTCYIAVIPLFVGILFLNKQNIKKYYKLLIIIVTLILVFYVFFFNSQVFNLLFGKVSMGNSSYISRTNSVYDNISVFLTHPVFGVGPKKLEKLLTGYSIVNTFLIHFSTFGFFVGVYYILGIYKFSKNLVNNSFSTLMFFICIILITSGENFTYSLLFNILLFLKSREKQRMIDSIIIDE